MAVLLPVLVLAAAVLSALWKFLQQRRLFQGLPGPPHHPILGHLPILRDAAQSIPPDANPHVFAHLIRKKYGLGDFFYLDIWPLAQPQLVIAAPELAADVAQRAVLDKGDAIRAFVAPLLGSKSLVAANGHDWRVARGLFNASMLHGNVLQHVPDIVHDTLKFQRTLQEHAERQDVFMMEDIAAKLIFNISTKAILGIDCYALEQDHEFMKLFRDQALLSPTEFWARYLVDVNLHRAYRRWVNRRKLDRYIGKVLDDRFSSGQEDACAKGKKKRCAVDYAVEAYSKGKGQAKRLIDDTLRDILVTQSKTLIFAGHDSSASTICHIYYFLSLYPEALRRVRAEHDEKFRDVSKAAEMLCRDPTLVNNLPYTLAVIMESLRLFPPIGGSYRSGRAGVHLKGDGVDWPTYPFACFINNYAIMHYENVFKDPESFIPERHLTKDPLDPYFVSPNAWRAFEKGPRNCIGEAMALIQIKIILVLTVSSFDFREMYADDAPLINGHKMYQTLHVTAKPSQGLPMRVKPVNVAWVE